MKTSLITLIILLVLTAHQAKSQHEESEHPTTSHKEGPHEEGEHKKHYLLLAIGHTSVSEGFQNGQKKWLVLPSWGLIYDYRFIPQMSVGLHMDWIVENFEVEEHLGSKDVVKSRSRPIALVGVASWHFIHTVALEVGGGMEFAPEENLGLMRIGVVGGWPILKNMEVGPSISYDVRFNAFDTWNISLEIGWRL